MFNTKSILQKTMGVFALSLFLCTTSLQASERIKHFEADKPKTVEAALSQLEAKLAEVHQALAKSDLHRVHEISYSLEASLDRLKEFDAELDKVLVQLEEKVEAIHHGSEDNKLVQVQTNYPQAKRLSGKLKKLFKK